MAKPAAGSGAISLAMILPPLSAMPQPKGMKRPTGQFSPQTSIHLLNTNQSGQNAPLDDPGFSIGAHRAVNLRQAHIFTPQTPLQPAFPPAKAQEPRQS